MKLLRCFSFLLCMLIYSKNFSQQTISIKFQHLTPKEGLCSPNVIKIYQGYLWFYTWDGLQRYDGKNFKTFYNIPGNKNSFPQGEITDIKEDKFGRYWITIGEHGGLCIYNPANESITRFNSSTDTLFTESNGLSEVEFAADSSTALLSSFYGLYKFDVSINGNDSLFDTYDLEYNSKGEIIFLSYNYIPDFSSGYNESYNYNSLGNVTKVLHFPIGIVSKRLYNTKYSSYEEYTVSKYDDKLNFMCGIYRYRFMELFKRKKLLVHLVY